MKDIYNLIWSDEALEGFKEIIVYLELNFSEKDVKKFARRFDKQLKIIQTNPFAFSRSYQSKKIRRSIVAKLTSIYYSIEDDSIKLISIRDVRKDQSFI